MSARLTRERMLDAIEAQVGLVRYALAPGGDPGDVALTTRVPSCPEWTLHDLVAHLGAVNWWGGATVREGNPDERSRGLGAAMKSAPPATEGAGALADWYAPLASGMLETFTETDPDAPAWTFGGPGPAAFWLRRQLHETALHRWDLENALGGPAATTPLPEDVAVDTVDEFCSVMFPHTAGRRPPLRVTIRLRALPHVAEGLATGAEPVGATATGPAEWVLSGGDGAPEVEVAGTPETLALLLWGRVGADEAGLEISGDRAGLVAALEGGLSA
ncbi:maleylpyruvate isomerase family mycothiol-dependent enzyme [Rhodococcus sp. IEGM 1408]|uniref:maleylpyruvate isomerase family mycothiol-dependent enzyme n=1 Tax=Rhodococcus sp. IEGM 1408 TaxID=3082220 RepID=UPI0029557259|nr:maleylpyruvate isomerase family mycothiol-dependent enzyme [Rhodococcus sp. IEGM 1408]MDV8001993.1 maleylpyruvate isomerase family mycothiol-dependent enzyme [Rhodococcus sp. IEGM 1408]